jgi:very-short-patch-repair endonuclease
MSSNEVNRFAAILGTNNDNNKDPEEERLEKIAKEFLEEEEKKKREDLDALSFKFDWRHEAEKLDPRVRQIFDDMLDEYARKMVASINFCESPIEQLMMLAFRSQKGNYLALTDDGEIKILQQEEIKIGKEKFRVDFLVLARVGKKRHKIIVECDGHIFHEKTKEQAVKDKRRSRLLALEGYVVLHYTGSEIWNNPFGCAREVLGFIFKDRGEA